MKKNTDITPVPLNCGVAGYVSLYKIHKDKITNRETPAELVAKAEKVASFKNLILNQGLDSLMLNSFVNSMSFCAVGSGSTEPLETDTGLVSELARTTTRVGVSPSPTLVEAAYHYTTSYQYTFALGAIDANVSEISIGINSGSVSVTRALIKDDLGNPTVIPVDVEEQLIVIYSLVKVIPTASAFGTLTLDFNGTPTDYAVEIKPANLGNTNNSYFFSASKSLTDAVAAVYAYETQALGLVTGTPSGASLAGTQTTESYVPGTYYRDYTVSAGLTECNFATGIGSAVFMLGGFTGVFGGYQVSFTPKLPKNADRLLSIPIRLSWARI